MQTAFLSGATRFLRFLFVCLLMFLILTANEPIHAMGNTPPEAGNCNIHHNTCTQKLSETEVVLDIRPKPVKAMRNLKFKITLKGKQPPGAPYIDLGMPGMEMGPNRVPLKISEQGVYEGTGIIVRCPTGKRIWKATVTVPETGSVEFVFDVIY